jgi:16S rRNA (guanine527-N7)-methyltransferase
LETIVKYFPDLPSVQLERLGALKALYTEWNARINVISRKDMDNFYLHHVLHSMSLMKVVVFRPGTRILDVGTGGGFPGIPLAICFPDCRFLLVDSIGKKTKVVQAVADQLGLNNVQVLQSRAEAVNDRFDFVVSRAVTTLSTFWSWVSAKIEPHGNNAIPNGVLYLKGGDMMEEIRQLKAVCRIFEISAFFDEPYFAEKKVVHVSNRSPKKNFDKTKNG